MKRIHATVTEVNLDYNNLFTGEDTNVNQVATQEAEPATSDSEIHEGRNKNEHLEESMLLE